jgi:chromosome segregation ATPase
MHHKPNSIFEAASQILFSENQEQKFHQVRIKEIKKTIASTEADKKSLESMISKMEKSLAKLVYNHEKLEAKLDKYKTLLVAVEDDPNYKLPGSLDALKF